MSLKSRLASALAQVRDGTISQDVPRGMGESHPLSPSFEPLFATKQSLEQELTCVLSESMPCFAPFWSGNASEASMCETYSADDYSDNAEFLSHSIESPAFSDSLDADADSLPDETLLSQLPFGHPPSTFAPEISALSKRLEIQELKSLEEFAISQLTFAVFDCSLYVYKAPCWRQLDAHTTTILLKQLFSPHGLDRHLNSRNYKELYNALLTAPVLQRGTKPEPPLHYLNLLDTTLHLESLTFHPHNPSDGFFSYLNVSKSDILDPGDGSVFERFINEVSNGDTTVRQQVLELVALACTEYPIKAFYVLVGPSGTGKSQLARFLVELLGHTRASSIGGIHEMAGRFSMAEMEDKALAVCMDLPDTPLPATAIGVLKVATGSDPKKLESKHRNPKTVYRSPLWLFATNFKLKIPKIEQEDAFLQRMILLPMLCPVPPERQVQQLYKKLLEEAPYILRESIFAYKNLMANNFVLTRSQIPPEYSPGEARESVEEIENFLHTYCEVDNEASITTEHLYQAFLSHANSNRSQFVTKIAFAKILAEVLTKYPSVSEVKRAEHTEHRGYRGIRLSDSL